MSCSGNCMICMELCRGRKVVVIRHSANTDHDQVVCEECWVRIMNERYNIDGSNEYGIRPIVCPHCQMEIRSNDNGYPHVRFMTCSIDIPLRVNNNDPNTLIIMTVDNNTSVNSMIHTMKTQFDTGIHDYLQFYLEPSHTLLNANTFIGDYEDVFDDDTYIDAVISIE